jgi:hypothetical protein
VRVFEIDPPQGQIPIEWFLLTTEPIETEEQLLRVVDIYRCRWVIEISHSSCTSCHRSLCRAPLIETDPRHVQSVAA